MAGSVLSRHITSGGDTPYHLAERAYAGGAISDYDIVIINGMRKQSPQVVQADTDAAATARGDLYVAVGSASAAGDEIYIVPWRIRRDVDTSGFTAARDPAFLSGTAGEVAASAGTVAQQVGTVLNVNASTGVLRLNPQSLAMGHVVLNGTVSRTFAVNQDGAAATDEDAQITLVGGDGTDLHTHTITQDTSNRRYNSAAQAGVASAGATAATAGNAHRFVSGAGGANTGGATGQVGGAGGGFVYVGGVGGATNSTGAHASGAGGGYTFTAGAAGNSTGATATAAGNGGGFTFTLGAGGGQAGTGDGGTGGAYLVTLGAGGAQTGAGASGEGGAASTYTVTGGVGGATDNTGTDAAGAGSTFTYTGGAGGAATGAGASNGGAGGGFTFTGGAGGASTGGTAGVGGNFSVQPGAGSTDGTFRILDPDDATAIAVIETDGIPTSTTRTMRVADATFRQLTTITTTQVLALNATPITVVTAAGADTYIEFVSAHLFLDYNSAAYAGVATGEDLIFSYTNGAGEEVSRVETTGFLDQTNDEHRIALAQSPAQDTATTITPVANAAIVISLLSGEITTGDSPLIVEVLYRIRDLTPA